jgi:hypothetical protein
VCKSAQKNAHEHTGSAEAIRHSLRNGLRLISRSPRRSGFLVTVAGGVLTANLTPASRRQDHTTLPSASVPFVNGTSASTASHPAFVTTAKRPSSGTRRREYSSDLWFRKIRIFLQRGLDSFLPDGQISGAMFANLVRSAAVTQWGDAENRPALLASAESSRRYGSAAPCPGNGRS